MLFRKLMITALLFSITNPILARSEEDFSQGTFNITENTFRPFRFMRNLEDLNPSEGYKRIWTLKIEVETNEQSDIEQSFRLFSNNGFDSQFSQTTDTNHPKPLLKITGIKDFDAADIKADIMVDEINDSTEKTRKQLHISISSKLVRISH